MSTIQVETPPAAEPVSLATVKSHLRVTLSNDDVLISLYMQAARELIEAESGRSLVNKVYRQTHDRFPHRHEQWDAGSGYSYCAHRATRVTGATCARRSSRYGLRSSRCRRSTYVDTAGTLQTLLPTPETWLANNEYEIGDQVTDGTYLQEVTAVTEAKEDESSTSEIPWSLRRGNAAFNGTTADGDLTWTNRGAAPAGDFLVDRDSEPPRILPLYAQFWPQTQHVPNAVKIYFTAGYGNDAAAAPATLKVGLMMAVGVSYENREAVTAEQLRLLDWYERMIWSQRILDWNPTK